MKLEEKAIMFETDNIDYPYCVQIHVSNDGGRNYFLRTCRYFAKEAWAIAFAETIGFEVVEEECQTTGGEEKEPFLMFRDKKLWGVEYGT